MPNITLPLLNLDAHLRTYSHIEQGKDCFDVLDILYLNRHSMVNQVLKNRFYGNSNITSTDTLINVDFSNFGDLEILQHKRLYCFVDTVMRPLSILSQLCARASTYSSRQNPFVGKRDDVGRFGSFEESLFGYLEARTELHSEFFMGMSNAADILQDVSSPVALEDRRALIFNITKRKDAVESAPVTLITSIHSPIYNAVVRLCRRTRTRFVNKSITNIFNVETTAFLKSSCAGTEGSICIEDVIQELGHLEQALDQEYAALEEYYAVPSDGSFVIQNKTSCPSNIVVITNTFAKADTRKRLPDTETKYTYLGSSQFETHAERVIPKAFLFFTQIAMRIAELDEIFELLLNVKKESDCDDSVVKAFKTLTGSKSILPNLVDLKRNIINGTLQKGTGLHDIAVNKETTVKYVNDDGSSYFKPESVITAKLSGHTAAYQVLFDNILRLDSDKKYTDYDSAVEELSKQSSLNIDEATLCDKLRPKSRFPNESYVDFTKPSNLNAYDFEILLYPSEYVALLDVVSNCIDEIVALQNEAPNQGSSLSNRTIYEDSYGRNVSQAGVRIKEGDPSELVSMPPDRYIKDLQGYSRRYNFCIGKSGFGYTDRMRNVQIEVFRFEDSDKGLLSVATVEYDATSDCGVRLYESNAAGNARTCSGTSQDRYADACCFIARYFREIGLCTFGFLFKEVEIAIGDVHFNIKSELDFKDANKEIQKIIKDSNKKLSIEDVNLIKIDGSRGFNYASEIYTTCVSVQEWAKLPKDTFFEPALLFVLKLIIKKDGKQRNTLMCRKDFYMTEAICERLRGEPDISNVQLAIFRRQLQ